MVKDINQAAQLYINAWDKMDFTEFFSELHPNCRYASQYVFEDHDSREKIIQYLTEKIASVKKIGNKVIAKPASLEAGATVFPRSGEPCVAVYQFGSDEIAAVVFFEVTEGKISSISLCMPELYQVTVKPAGATDEGKQQ